MLARVYLLLADSGHVPVRNQLNKLRAEIGGPQLFPVPCLSQVIQPMSTADPWNFLQTILMKCLDKVRTGIHFLILKSAAHSNWPGRHTLLVDF